MHPAATERYPASVARPSGKATSQRWGNSEAELRSLASRAKRQGDRATETLILSTVRRLHCSHCRVDITVPFRVVDAAFDYSHAYATHALDCAASE